MITDKTSRQYRSTLGNKESRHCMVLMLEHEGQMPRSDANSDFLASACLRIQLCPCLGATEALKPILKERTNVSTGRAYHDKGDQGLCVA